MVAGFASRRGGPIPAAGSWAEGMHAGQEVSNAQHSPWPRLCQTPGVPPLALPAGHWPRRRGASKRAGGARPPEGCAGQERRALCQDGGRARPGLLTGRWRHLGLCPSTRQEAARHTPAALRNALPAYWQQCCCSYQPRLHNAFTWYPAWPAPAAGGQGGAVAAADGGGGAECHAQCPGCRPGEPRCGGYHCRGRLLRLLRSGAASVLPPRKNMQDVAADAAGSLCVARSPRRRPP